MKNLILAVALIYSQLSSAHTEKKWLGTWVSKKLVCPFGCSQLMHNLFEKSKNKKFHFSADSISDASGMSADCLKPSKPDYTGLKLVKAEKYLLGNSQNAQANGKSNIKRKLPKLLGVKPSKEVTAGVIRCFDVNGNLTATSQNIIFIDANQAFALFEENAYWELSR